jgi:hypothetical protein
MPWQQDTEHQGDGDKIDKKYAVHTMFAACVIGTPILPTDCTRDDSILRALRPVFE